MYEETLNKIVVHFNNGKTVEYRGNYYIYREDFAKEGCVHFKGSDGKHHRIYGGVVIIDEE